MKIEGRVWKFGDNINTDLIFPGTSFRLPPEKQANLVFSANRPEWARGVTTGDIIVSGRNFGTGSARPGAVLFKRLGLGGLVAESINGVFFRNCVNNGFPALQCEGVHQAFQEGDVAEIDLAAGTVRNRRTQKTLRGVGLPQSIVEVIEAGGILPLLRREGYLD